MNYTFDIQYVNTKLFGNADSLSRLPCPEVKSIEIDEVEQIQNESMESMPVTAEMIADEIMKDKCLKVVKQFIKHGWPDKIKDDEIKTYASQKSELSMHNKCILFGTRIVIPAKFRKQTLELIHATHPGIVRMKALARQKVWWPGLDKDIEQMRLKCKICQASGSEERKIQLHPWETPERPWQRLHIDFCDFWSSKWLIVIDARTKWLEAIRMGLITADATIEALRTIWATHGLPEQIVSDNGPPYSSAAFNQYCQSRGITHTTIAPYKPQSNGCAERAVRTFKEGVKNAR